MCNIITIKLTEKNMQFLKAWYAASHLQLKQFVERCNENGTIESYQAWIKYLADGHKELKNLLIPGSDNSVMADEKLIDLFLKESRQETIQSFINPTIID